nr:MAG TPA: hypothetical protein [Caudoviricetes sp.]
MTKYLDNEGLTHFTGKMKEYADGKAGEVDGKVTTHVGNKQNPHGVTKEQVGLSKVINETQIPSNQKGFANGVATLDAKGKVPVEQMPTTKTINGASIFGSGNLQLSASLYKIVDTLPTTGIDTSKIYLVPASATTAKNNKTEYIYLGDPNKAYDESKWEKLGDEQKSSTITTPGGSIKVDTALIKDSPNPVAGGVVKAKFDEVDGKLADKVESSDYTTKMTAIDSKLKTLENKTIDVDAELKVSTNPVQNTAVKKAVDDLNTEIGKKANSTDLNAAAGKITTLETNAATILSVTGEGNGISSISKSGNTITAKKGNFLTSAAGLATTAALNDGLAKKADVDHNHDTKYAAKKHTHPEYAQSSALNDYVTKTALDGKNFLTATSLNGYVNEVQPDGTSGNGIANITKEGKVLKVTKATFLTGHQSLDGYVNNVKVTGVANGNGIASIAKNGKDINVTQGAFLTAIDGIIAETGEAVAGKGVTDISIRGNKLVKKTGTFVTPATLGDAIDSYASNKGYLTKDNLNEKLKETVTIKLVSDKSASDTNLNGATVTVKSGDTTVSTQTWQGTPINVKVPCDKDVTIEAAAVKMYVKPKMLKYVPSPLYNREVTFTYKALELGVFIVDTNDNLINKDSWSPTMEQTTVGVALITEKVAIVISTGLHTDLCWSKTYQLVGGVTTTTDSTVAATDYKGKANTEAIGKVLGQNAPAAYYCSNYTFKNGKKGYLMAAGEAQEIFVNMQKISELLNYINPSTTNLANGYEVWTSTQNNNSTAWLHDGMSLKTLSKTVGNNYVVPIYSLND